MGTGSVVSFEWKRLDIVLGAFCFDSPTSASIRSLWPAIGSFNPNFLSPSCAQIPAPRASFNNLSISTTTSSALGLSLGS